MPQYRVKGTDLRIDTTIIPEGSPIELSEEEAAKLAEYLEGYEAPLQSGEVITQLETAITELENQLEQYRTQLGIEAAAKNDAQEKLAAVERDLAATRDANAKNADDLAAARERIAALEAELAAASSPEATPTAPAGEGKKGGKS